MKKPVEIWIDALDFKNQGGWKEDTQYVHLMGSGFLLAADQPGVPVADATVQVKIPEKSTYRIWVRDRNWLRPHNPGKFTVLVNGKETGNVLGQLPSDSWLWEIAGDVELEEGEITLSLHDLTGYFGRCASILITNDFDFTPPRELDRLHAERARIKGLNPGITYCGDYDVIVAGGGPGGVPAAIAAARLGSKVLIIQNRPILGGNASAEIGVPSYGAEVAHVHAREGGIAEEIMRLRDRETEKVGEWTRAMEKLVAAEENITVIYNSHVCGVEMADSAHIKGVTVLNFRTLEKTAYTARIFIDCTGDAWLGYYAGAKYRYGREANWQHNEGIAPEIPDTLSMSGCIKAGDRPFFSYAEEEVEFHAPEWVPKLPEDDDEFGRVIKDPTKMYWWLEAPNTYDDIYDGEETRDALLLVLLGYFDHLKNHWSKKDTIKNLKFNFAGIVNGRRESRRLIGDYVLTQDDCTSGKVFEDTISYSGWALDLHHPMGIYSGKEGPLHSGKNVPIVKVPYRCLYSVNIENLLFAGRNVSATHVAIGTLRVQNTIMTLGQAVGTAASLCLKLGETPRGIYERHLRTLQQLLIRHDQYIPSFKNEDENDLCLTADVTASSVSTTEIYNGKHGVDGPLLPLDEVRTTVFGISLKHKEVAQLYLKLHSTHSEPFPVTVHARTEGDLDTTPQPGPEFTAQAMVPPMCESWVGFDINLPLDDTVTGGYLRVWLDKAEGISWRSIENLSFYRQAGILGEDGKWKMETGKSLHALPKKPNEIFANCSPETTINGYSRILSSDIYEWVSDPNQALPQWIEFDFKKTVEFNTVSLVFDTDMTNPGTCRDTKFPGVPFCVKDYTVEVLSGGEWKTVADIKENFMRKRNHTFETVSAEKLRVTVFSTWGNPSARITEVRAALEK